MLMTEKDAKTKWCSHTRVGEQASGAAENRPDGSYNCIASACMAWRWAEERNAEVEAEFEASCPSGASMGCEVVGPQPVGYCGLAGKPEGE